MRYFIICALPLLLIVGCNKEKKHKTRAQGVVVDAPTGKPVPNAWVGMKDGMGNSGPINVGSASGDGYVEMYTNAKGEFDMELEGIYTAYLSVGKEQYYPYRFANGGASIGWRPLNEGLNAGLQMPLESMGYFDPIFMYKGLGNFEDSLIVTVLSYRNKNTPINFNYGILFIGKSPHKYSPSEGGSQLQGNRYHPFRVKFRPANGVWVEYLDSAFVPALGTLRDTIYYPKP